MTNARLTQLKDRGIDEFRRFLLMFVYLWVVFGLFVLNESLVLSERHIIFTSQGFAVINAAIMAKVMLIAEKLKLGRRFDHLPLIYSVAHKAAVFSLVFMAFHAAEHLVAGLIGGHSVAESLPHIGGGTWRGRLTVWAIMAISLLPFFALHEIGQLIGEGRMWSIMFRARPKRLVVED